MANPPQRARAQITGAHRNLTHGRANLKNIPTAEYHSALRGLTKSPPDQSISGIINSTT